VETTLINRECEEATKTPVPSEMGGKKMGGYIKKPGRTGGKTLHRKPRPLITKWTKKEAGTKGTTAKKVVFGQNTGGVFSVTLQQGEGWGRG